MRFFLILSVDVPRDVPINKWAPSRRLKRKLQLTEGDDCYEYSYLGDCWAKGKHRKWVGELNKEDFDEVVTDLGLYASPVDTMGSLTPDGLLPAIAFEVGEAYDAIISMYVTPFPEVTPGNWRSDESRYNAWERVKSAVVATWG